MLVKTNYQILLYGIFKKSVQNVMVVTVQTLAIIGYCTNCLKFNQKKVIRKFVLSLKGSGRRQQRIKDDTISNFKPDYTFENDSCLDRQEFGNPLQNLQ